MMDEVYAEATNPEPSFSDDYSVHISFHLGYASENTYARRHTVRGCDAAAARWTRSEMAKVAGRVVSVTEVFLMSRWIF